MNKEMREYYDKMKSTVTNPVVNYATHVPTNDELNNLCYLSMKYLVGWQMRVADFQVVKMMGGEVKSVKQLDEKFIPELASYIWDHLMGEPDDPTISDIEEGVKLMRDALFCMNETIRNDVIARAEPEV